MSTAERKPRFPAIDSLSESLARGPSRQDGQSRPPTSTQGQVQAKTRFLNFRLAPSGPGAATDARPQSGGGRPGTASPTLTIVGGPGTGEVFEITKPVLQIGRGPGQDIQLDFGDLAISRRCHASIVYYGAEDGFTIRDGMKPNPVLVNGGTLRGERKLEDGDTVYLGVTSLRFRDPARDVGHPL